MIALTSPLHQEKGLKSKLNAMLADNPIKHIVVLCPSTALRVTLLRDPFITTNWYPI